VIVASTPSTAPTGVSHTVASRPSAFSRVRFQALTASPAAARLRAIGPSHDPRAEHRDAYVGKLPPVTPIEQRFRRPSVMGIINVTPDSFSDGGVNHDAGDAIASARRMVEEGAAIVDVGGESTRPGSDGVPLDEELRRVIPVLEALEGLPVSIDTAKAEVARRALALGAVLVNDVTALRGDPELAGVVADSGAYLCLMHMRGEPRTMQDDPRYDDVAGEVAAFLEERLGVAVAAGIPEERVCLDPGIGFGKSVEQNVELVRRLDVLLALGRPVLVGLSRKRSLGRLVGDASATTGSLAASIGAAVAAFDRGASILRVHDVRETVEALTVAGAMS
jgi:dihydropteroate synthase